MAEHGKNGRFSSQISHVSNHSLFATTHSTPTVPGLWPVLPLPLNRLESSKTWLSSSQETDVWCPRNTSALFYLSESENHSVVSYSFRPQDCTVHGILQARILEWVAFPFSGGSSQPRDRTQVSHITGRFFTSWATGKPKNTGVVAYPFSSRSSRCRNWTRVSCFAGRFLQETPVQFLGWEDTLEKGKTPIFLPGEFHGQSMGLQRVGHDWATFTSFSV